MQELLSTAEAAVEADQVVRAVPSASATPRAVRPAAEPVRPARVARPAAHTPCCHTRLDRRSARSREHLRDALAAEVQATGDLTRVTVTGLTERAGLTRRTFYSHFHDIPDLVAAVEREALVDIRELVEAIAASHLDELVASLESCEPAPGAVELLCYFRDNASHLTALLGDGGDPAFVEKIKQVCTEAICSRALDGIDVRALGPFFDYYLAFAVSAECGVLTRWLAGGMREDVHTMARIMTALMFVRPGDLYGKAIDFNVPAYALALMRTTKFDPAVTKLDPATVPATKGGHGEAAPHVPSGETTTHAHGDALAVTNEESNHD